MLRDRRPIDRDHTGVVSSDAAVGARDDKGIAARTEAASQPVDRRPHERCATQRLAMSRSEDGGCGEIQFFIFDSIVVRRCNVVAACHSCRAARWTD